MKKFISMILVIGLAALASVAFASDSSWSRIKEKGTVTIGFCAAYPPFESRNEKTGKFEGFDVDLGMALAKEMGVKASFVDGEWQGLIGGLHKGDYDILMTCMSRSEGRGKNVTFSNTYYELNDVIVVRSDDDRIESEKDLKGMTVGAQQGSGAMQVMDGLEGLGDRKYYNYNPEAFLDLKNKRIDSVIVGLAYAVTQIKRDPAYRIIGPAGEAAEIVAVMPQGSEELKEKFNTALDSLREKGEWQRLVDLWFSVE